MTEKEKKRLKDMLLDLITLQDIISYHAYVAENHDFAAKYVAERNELHDEIFEFVRTITEREGK